ncbi:MAG: NAD-dependent epimerase/dehydratase family protein [Gemmatimonadaceae bacterium]
MAGSVAVTGANGYVGSSIARSLEEQGLGVVRLQRSGQGDAVRRFALGEPVDPTVFQGVSSLVHCAYDFNAAGWLDIERANVTGSLDLFQAARDAGVQTIIFISSMSAFEGCRSMYGRAKLEVEQRAQPLGVYSVRPGLVYGKESGGMIAALSKLLGLPLITPLVGSGSQVLYLVHDADLGQMIGELCTGAKQLRGRPVIAANSRPFTFKSILGVLARRDGVKKAFVPVPWQLEWLALKSAELVGLRMRLRSDSLVSLINQDPNPDFSGSSQFSFRDFEDFTLGQDRSPAAV